MGEERILVIGDSWAAGVEADTQKEQGWPELLGIAHELRQGVSGSTAYDWAIDKNRCLTKAMRTPADIVVVSLMGNDMRAALADGVVTSDELCLAVSSLDYVLEKIARPKTLVMEYADPFSGHDEHSALIVERMNKLILASACRVEAAAPEGKLFVTVNTAAILDGSHFDCKDIHPTRAGHEVIAAEIRALIDALQE